MATMPVIVFTFDPRGLHAAIEAASTALTAGPFGEVMVLPEAMRTAIVRGIAQEIARKHEAAKAQPAAASRGGFEFL